MFQNLYKNQEVSSHGQLPPVWRQPVGQPYMRGRSYHAAGLLATTDAILEDTLWLGGASGGRTGNADMCR